MMRAGVGFPVVTVMVISCNSEYRITIPHEAVLIHGGVHVKYSRNNATTQLLSEGAAANQTQINHGWSELWSNDLDAIYDIPLSRGINAYVMAGGGGAIRRLSLTRTVGTGGPYCNDWAGFCDAGGYPGDVLVNSKTTGRWEWNAGVGLSFSLGGGDAFFVEARYVEVETPVPTGFVPIRMGLRL
jgi:opacity protein-like surface antigen